MNIKRIKTVWIGVIILFFFALFLLSSNLGKKSAWNPAEQIIIEIVAPLQKFILQTIRTTEGVWLKYFHLINVRDENRDLKREIDTLRMENNQYRELLTSNKRLQNLFQFKETLNYPVLAVEVIGWDPTGW